MMGHEGSYMDGKLYLNTAKRPKEVATGSIWDVRQGR